MFPSSKLSFVFCTTLLVSTAWAVSLLHAEAQEEKRVAFVNTFPGKIVLVTVDRSTTLESKSTSAVLESAEVKKIGNRYFLTGIGYAPDGVKAWYKGMEIGIAWDHVVRYHAMTDKQFETYATHWKEHYENED